MKTILNFVMMWLLIIPAPAVLAADSAPDALVKATVDDVLAVIKQNKDRQALRSLAAFVGAGEVGLRRVTPRRLRAPLARVISA